MGPLILHGPELSQEQEDAIYEALSQVHSAGVRHWDVHPRNILLPRPGMRASLGLLTLGLHALTLTGSLMR